MSTATPVTRVSDLSPSLLLAVAAGGSLGALGRYTLGLLVAEAMGDPDDLVIGWMTANVLGSLLLGFVAAMPGVQHRPRLRGFVAVGFLGAFTTFSAFAHDTWAFVVDGRIVTAIVVVVLGVAAPVAAATLGRHIAWHQAGTHVGDSPHGAGRRTNDQDVDLLSEGTGTNHTATNDVATDDMDGEARP